MQNLGKLHWTNLTSDSKPLGRSSHSISFNKVNNCSYLWGGEHVAREAIDSKLWVFDNTNNNWIVPFDKQNDIMYFENFDSLK